MGALSIPVGMLTTAGIATGAREGRFTASNSHFGEGSAVIRNWIGWMKRISHFIAMTSRPLPATP